MGKERLEYGTVRAALISGLTLAIAGGFALPVGAQAPLMNHPTVSAFVGSDGYGAPHPDAPPELKQFGQLVGTWDAEQQMRARDGSWQTIGSALWTWRYLPGGFAVQDLWFQDQADLPEYLGDLGRDYLLTAIRMYDVRAGAWRIAWTANGAGQTPGDDFGTAEATWDGERIVMTSPPNRYGHQRIIFSDISDSGFTWTSEFSEDGQGWQAVMRVFTRRVR